MDKQTSCQSKRARLLIWEVFSYEKSVPRSHASQFVLEMHSSCQCFFCVKMHTFFWIYASHLASCSLTPPCDQEQHPDHVKNLARQLQSGWSGNLGKNGKHLPGGIWPKWRWLHTETCRSSPPARIGSKAHNIVDNAGGDQSLCDGIGKPQQGGGECVGPRMESRGRLSAHSLLRDTLCCAGKPGAQAQGQVADTAAARWLVGSCHIYIQHPPAVVDSPSPQSCTSAKHRLVRPLSSPDVTATNVAIAAVGPR